MVDNKGDDMKTVMILVNGFGVEHKNSYSVYSQEVMPNIEKLIKKYMFSQLKASVSNYRDGYRNLCLEINEMYNYSIFDEENAKGMVFNNQVLINVKNELETRKSKLHVFCLIDNSEKIVEQLKGVIKSINPDKNKKIFLHIVLTSGNVEDYDKILKILSSINVDLVEYAQIGLVFGLGSISNNTPINELNFFIRMFISEVGEKWQSFSQKLDVCRGMKLFPFLVKPFIVNGGFSLDKNDLFFIWNYDKIDLTTFIEIIKNIKYGEENNNIKISSLFEIVANDKIDYMLNYHPANNSMVNNLTNINAKSLIMARKEQIGIINYYANGLQNVNSDRVNFIEIDNYLFKPNELLAIINKYDHDLMIINYDIEEARTIEELKTLLHNIDIMIGNIYENSKDSKYSLVISSLYGINKVMNNNKGERCNVIFNEKLPIIFIDNFVTKKDYLIEEGSIVNLLPVCYKKINDKYKGHSIVTKKNALYRLFFK